MKLLLTLIVLAVLVFVVMNMVRSWQGRRTTYTARMLAPFPSPPTELAGPDGAALLPATNMVYAGTSMAGDWPDQVRTGDVGIIGTATLHLSAAGLLVDRAAASPLWIPLDQMRGARIGRSVAGRVMKADGHLVITWQLGGYLLDTAFHGDEDTYPEWLDTLREIGEGRVHGGEGRARGEGWVPGREDE